MDYFIFKYTPYSKKTRSFIYSFPQKHYFNFVRNKLRFQKKKIHIYEAGSNIVAGELFPYFKMWFPKEVPILRIVEQKLICMRGFFDFNIFENHVISRTRNSVTFSDFVNDIPAFVESTLRRENCNPNTCECPNPHLFFRTNNSSLLF